MAVPGTSFSGTWQEHTFFENPELTRALGWRSVPEPKIIIEAANQFAGAQLELHARFAEITGLSALHSTVERLKAEVRAAQESPLTCLLALGWGNGFLAKAGSLTTDSEAYRKILRAVPSIGRAIRENVPFPKTRRIVFLKGQPASLPGWVRLQFEC